MTTVSALTPNDSRGWLTLENRHTGERMQLRRVRRDGELCLELTGSLRAGREGPPLHIHFREDEAITVLAGVLGAEVDGQRLEVRAGGTAPLPMGSAHRWWNAGDETLELEGSTKPLIDLDVYLAGAFDVFNSGPAHRPPLFYIAHLAWRHRKTQAVLFAPLWFQVVLLPAIVLVGTVLGRYRGTDWPGCPARCSAAPLVPESEVAISVIPGGGV